MIKIRRMERLLLKKHLDSLNLSSYFNFFLNKKIDTIQKLNKIKLVDVIDLNISKNDIKKLIFFIENYKKIKKNKKVKKNDRPIISSRLKKILFKKNNNLTIRLNCTSPIIKFNCESPIKISKIKNRGAMPKKIGPIILERPSYRKKILISFGIVDYKYWPKLVNALNDVNSLGEFAKDKLKFDLVYVYHNENVTKSSIEKIITNDLYKIANPNDLVVMSFHGHGYSINFDKFTEGFLVPYNASKNPTPFELISMNNLSKWFKYIKSRHVLLLLDCCFSGLSVLRNNKIDNYFKDEDLTINAISKHLNSNSKIIINAGTTYESVSDGGWNNNSVFTGAIISSPTLNDKIGSIMNLYYYLLKTIPRYSNQTPSIGKMEGDMGTDIFLKL